MSMHFSDIVKSRFATREFNGEMISEEKIHELLEIIRHAPTSFNLQPYKVKVVKDQETKDALFPYAYNQKQVSTCSHLLVFCIDTNVEKLIDKLEEHMIKAGSTKEQIAGYVDMMRNFAKGMNEDQRRTWAKAQAYIALGNALNGAKALGFDSCPMEGFNPQEFAKVLHLPKSLEAVVLCPVGYAVDKARPKVRFPKEEIFF